MNIYKPYTYLIGWSNYNKWYYGVRYAKDCCTSDLWNTYFTSSKYVNEFRTQYGEPDIIKIRKIFETPQKAHLYEQTVLRKLKILENDKWLNRNIGGTHNNPGNTSKRTSVQIEAARKCLKETMSKREHGTFYNRKHKKETILKYNSFPEIQCPNCFKFGKGNVMNRWHFDNCKSK